MKKAKQRETPPGKSRYIKLISPDDPSDRVWYIPYEDFDINDEFQGAEPGQILVLQLCELTDEEYERSGFENDYLECPQCGMFHIEPYGPNPGHFRCRDCWHEFTETRTGENG